MTTVVTQVLQQFTDDLVAIRTKVTLILSNLDMDLLEEQGQQVPNTAAMKFIKVIFKS